MFAKVAPSRYSVVNVSGVFREVEDRYSNALVFPHSLSPTITSFRSLRPIDLIVGNWIGVFVGIVFCRHRLGNASLSRVGNQIEEALASKIASDRDLDAIVICHVSYFVTSSQQGA